MTAWHIVSRTVCRTGALQRSDRQKTSPLATLMAAILTWAGHTITAVRLDPGNGAQGGGFAVDYLRAVK